MTTTLSIKSHREIILSEDILSKIPFLIGKYHFEKNKCPDTDSDIITMEKEIFNLINLVINVDKYSKNVNYSFQNYFDACNFLLIDPNFMKSNIESTFNRQSKINPNWLSDYLSIIDINDSIDAE